MTGGSSSLTNGSSEQRKSRLVSAFLWIVVIITVSLAIGTAYIEWLHYGREFVGGLPWLIGTGLSSFALGVFILARQPQNGYGWIWLGLGAAVTLMLFAQAYVYYSLLVTPSQLPLTNPMIALAGPAWGLMIAQASLIFLLFPNGQLPSSKWRWLLSTIVLVYCLTALMGVMAGGQEGIFGVDNPYGVAGQIGHILRRIGLMGISVLFFCVPLSVTSLLFRYRAGGVTERLQLRWFAFGSVLFLLIFVSDFFYTAPGIWEGIKEASGFVALLVTIGLAIVRHHLFDIDVIIRRTTSYALLTTLLALIYFGSIIVLQQVLTPLFGASDVAVVLSTLLIAALFLPLRKRIQDVIDRRFFRRKYDAEKVLERFAATARDETNLDALTAELVRVIQETMQPEHVSVWLKPTGDDRKKLQ